MFEPLKHFDKGRVFIFLYLGVVFLWTNPGIQKEIKKTLVIA